MDLNNIKTGLEGTIETLVTDKDTADNYGSGAVKVLATPRVVALMENAAMAAVDMHLPVGYVTVGTKIDIQHLKATPVGMRVRVNAVLEEFSGHRLVFTVEAYDEKELIAKGIHERFIVELKTFLERCEAKKL
ncbi:thioesterase family protein [Calorimonas adulescens]|uniref:Thioesterase n=1 Tax=Calorimonas adulescens TaxID=2606906 RepID=A0A5D8QAU1_9THEO|nr:thioesterase family protein [Calorimonas adulescens]TZE81582.1 thioesterase [Calorimonas adulescens]